MKIVVTILLVTGFIGIAIFSIFVMNHEARYGHNNCIVATARGADCPQKNGSFSFANFHIDAFRNFSTTTINSNPASALLLLIALLSINITKLITKIHPVLPILSIDYRLRRLLKSRQHLSERKLARWLSIHENSPSAA